MKNLSLSLTRSRQPICLRGVLRGCRKDFRLRTEEFFLERGERARTNKARRKILKRAGNEPPREGDEIL
jgi:hypothetical protein